MKKLVLALVIFLMLAVPSFGQQDSSSKDTGKEYKYPLLFPRPRLRPPPATGSANRQEEIKPVPGQVSAEKEKKGIVVIGDKPMSFKEAISKAKEQGRLSSDASSSPETPPPDPIIPQPMPTTTDADKPK